MPDTPLIDKALLESTLGGYVPPAAPGDLPNLAHTAPSLPMPGADGQPTPSALSALENSVLSPSGAKQMGGGIPRSLAESTSKRYDAFVPGNYNNEDAYAQGQGWTDKMVNGVGKGLLLTGTTFLQSTLGLANGLARWAIDGRAASFYDNEFNRQLDEINKASEDYLPNYYKDVEKNSSWYSPSKLISANFFWDGIIKNMGFAAGAALSGNVYSSAIKGLSSLPALSKLFSVGKAAEALAATEEGLLAANKVADTYGKVKGLSDKFLSTYNTLNVGQRAVVAGLATTGEAGFEAFHNLNDFRNEKIREYTEANGVPPTGQALDEINAAADAVGNSSFLLNTGLLTATNYIQFPKILGASYRAEKGIVNSLTREIGDITKDAAGNIIAKPTRFGKIVSTLDKVRPYTFSIAEGFEEGAQYAIQVGTKDYYNKKYKGDATSFLASLSEGVTQTLGTNEGMENVLIGGLSGALMSARGKYAENKEIAANTTAAIELFNKYKLSDFTKDTIDSVNRGTILQQERENLIRQGDVLESKDKEADYIINYLTPRIKYGRFDLVRSDIEDYRRLASTDEGFAQLQAEGKAFAEDTKESYLQRLASLEQTADNVKSLYQSLNLRYGGLVKDGKAVYSPEIMDKMVYAASKIADYDKRIPKVMEPLINAGINVTDVLQGVTRDGKANQEATVTALEEINNMKNVTSDVKDQLKTSLLDALELSLRREKFISEYDQMKKDPASYEEKPVDETTPAVVQQTQEDKTVKKALEVGREYSLEEPIRREGNTLQLAPKIGIVSKSLGGEFQVKLPNGETTFLTPEQFKEYKISDQDNASEDLATLLDKTIDTVLAKDKYSDIQKPTDNKLGYVNSLDNKELMDDIEAKFVADSEEYIKQAKAAANNAKMFKDLTDSLDTQNIEVAVADENTEGDNSNMKIPTVLPRATVASEKIPGYKNSVLFGTRLGGFANREKIRGVYVTQANEKQLGLDGLMVHLKGDSNVDPAKTIAVVMVEQNGNKITPVGIDGKPLTNVTVESAIYQVMPDPALRYSEEFGGKSMFREGTSQETIDYLSNLYKEFVDQTLTETQVVPFKIEASFGIPIVEKGSKTAIADAALIKPSELNTRAVLTVPTTPGAIKKGSTYYTNPLGKIFLNTANGYVLLQNNKHTAKQAETIFQVIKKLAENKQDNVNETESEEIIDWLRTVVFWGTPKRGAGVNSVWFDKGQLFISNKGKKYTFTSEAIELNKDNIIADLQEIYHNVRSSFVATDLKTNGIENWQLPYTQILGVSKDGQIERKQWKNYQTYLLSSQGRNAEDIPLTTNIKPVQGDEINRKSVYFVNTESAAKYAAPIEKTSSSVVSLTPGAPKTDVVVAPTNINLDGKTVNTISNPAFGTVRFIATPEGVANDEISFVENDPGNTDAFTKVDQNTLVLSIIDKIKREQGTVTPVAPVITPAAKEDNITVDDEELMRQQMDSMQDDVPLRIKLREKVDSFEKENWPKIEKFLKEKFPNLPIYRVKNIITNAAGDEVFGMFKDGAIYVYEGAETGTVYHEVFHGVFRMFTSSEERDSIRNEFRDRSGSFVDRASGQTIKYSDATDEQIEEALAEELIDYIQNGKVPVKPKDGRPFIVKLFSDFVNFVKTFFVGPRAKSNTEQLFKNINTGTFKEFAPYNASLAYAKRGIIDIDEAVATAGSVLRLKMPGQTVHDIMQQMTYITLTDLVRNDESLFNIMNIKREDLYTKLKIDLQKTALKSRKEAENDVRDGKMTNQAAAPIIAKSNALWKTITENWTDIAAKHEEYLKSYSIEFDENDEASYKEDKVKGDPYGEAHKIDAYKKAAAAVKILLATVPIMKNGKLDYSSINGVRLLPASEVHMAILNKVHTARNPDEMLSRIAEMAKDDENYQKLYERITKTPYDSDTFDFSSLKNTHNLSLVSALWKLFKKQSPDVKNLFILEDGQVQVGDSNFGTAARQLSGKFTSSVVNVVKSKPSWFVYSSEQKSFIARIDGKTGRPVIEEESVDGPDNQRRFLSKLGIEFTADEYARLGLNGGSDQDRFQEAVRGIKQSFVETKKITNFSGKTLSIKGRLMTLAELKVKLANPEFDSTFYNINGETTQAFLGVNAASQLYDFLSQANNIEDLRGTPYEYLLTDTFTKNSVILGKMFDLGPNGTGDRISGSNELMKTSWADGTNNAMNGKKKSSSRLTYKERLIQEINMNLAGYYYNLIPGDASLEWQMFMSNAITADSLRAGYDQEGGVFDIFGKYFIDEVNLARDNRPTKDSKDLRFFKNILGEEFQDKLLALPDSAEDIYKNNKKAIDTAVSLFITKKTNVFKKTLDTYGIISETGKGNIWQVNNLSFAKGEGVRQDVLDRNLTALTINFMINNIELHKLLYSDPYQYKEELKRIKSFNSPRQAIISNSTNMNQAFDKVWNKGYEFDDIAYTDFSQDFFKTVTMADINAVGELSDYIDEPYEESDGAGIIMFKAHRNFKIRASDWTDANERQYRYDMAWEKEDKGLDLSEEERELLANGNPKVKSTYTAIKPSVSGSKVNGQSYNDVVLDKFALYPLSYRIIKQTNELGDKKTSNALKLYQKMQDENIDYSIFKSGRKVGSQELHNVYGEKGEFNTAKYNEAAIVNVPFGIMAVQSEVPSKEEDLVTRGSQTTKLVTMDFMAAGVPVDFEPGGDINARYQEWTDLSEAQKQSRSPLYREIRSNKLLLEELMENGYQTLLKQMGLTENADGTFTVNNGKMGETLRKEILKREVNDNIADALAGFLDGHVVLEATPAYQQIRNILYSIADREVISPKISGGMKVQIPSSFFEENRKVSKDGKNYTSDVLDFYVDKDGKRVCEVMVGRWFKSDKTDQELLDEWYTTDDNGNKVLTKEGAKVLSGIGFRIPTQKQNSIDSFVIKQFLPEEFGDNVVIPSALVKKAGSDFDIDKLSMYLKNLYQDKNGNMKLVPYYGKGEEAKAKLKQLGIEESVEKTYRKSLENEYIQSLQNLVSSKENFAALTKPNSAEDLKKLAKEITGKLGFDEFDYESLDNMLDRHFMSRLRHAFVTGKYAIGIAARNQTNHSLNQRQPIYIDLDKLGIQNEADQHWLGDGQIRFNNYNKITINGKTYATVSMIDNTDGKRISDINAQFIDGYVDISKGPWIMELGATPNVASTWMFLNSIGIPIDTVAYFMNQPIVRDYLAKIENAGYSWLFIDDYVTEIKKLSKYSVPENYDFSKIKEIPSKTSLRETIGAKTLTKDQRAEQQFILDEFLKYAKMASQMFTFSQGTNFDTATFNDPYLIFKKLEQLKRAENSIFSSANELLKNSFLGELRNKLEKIRNSFVPILKSDNKNIRTVIENVLLPYIDLPDADFIKVSQKAVADLFDWAVQTNPDKKLNEQITKLLLDKDNAAGQISDFINVVKNTPNHPLRNNEIVKLLTPIISGSVNGVNNAKIDNKSNKIYDQNQIIYGFSELKAFLEKNGSPIYNRLVRLAVVQSGLSNSPISFTSLLPYEDLLEMYNSTLDNLENLPNLADFHNLNVFQRNNWNNDDVVPSRRAKMVMGDNKKMYYQNNTRFYGNPDLDDATMAGVIPQLMKLSSLAAEANSDVVIYSWESIPPGKTKYQMIKEGDMSFIKKGLFKKVYDGNTPLTILNKYNTPTYIYKMINAWGDSRRVGENYFGANEFYDVAKKSVIDNGFIPANEVDDETIIPFFRKEEVKTETVIDEETQQEEVKDLGQVIEEEINAAEQEEAEEMLTGKKPIIPSGKVRLKNGNEYEIADINTEVLNNLGYSSAQINEILKTICKLG
jgi:hypothetical protein